jgi:primosomal replication protein N
LSRNQFVLDAEVIEVDALRHTPAGVPVMSLKLKHESQQDEAGNPGTAKFEISAVAFADTAIDLSIIQPGQTLSVKGFMNRKNRFSEYPVLHITQFKLII